MSASPEFTPSLSEKLFEASEKENLGDVDSLIRANADVNCHTNALKDKVKYGSEEGELPKPITSFVDSDEVATRTGRRGENKEGAQERDELRTTKLKVEQEAAQKAEELRAERVKAEKEAAVAKARQEILEETHKIEKDAAELKQKMEQEMEQLKAQHQQHLEQIELLEQSRSIAPPAPYLGKEVGQWSVDDSQLWVGCLGAAYAKYSPLFVENGVDGQTLLLCEAKDLEQVGVLPVHAKAILQKLKSHVERQAPRNATPPPPDDASPSPSYAPLYSCVDIDDDSALDLSRLVIDKNKRLGGGNFGEVCLGMVGEREVAVKMIKKDATKKEKADLEFDKEISTWAHIPQHDNVAQLLGVVEKDGCRCIVMPVYRGGTLKGQLDSSRTRGSFLKKTKILSILLDITNGLKHLHDHKIVHRDLAARNILFDTNNLGRAVISDFGLSREIGLEAGKEYYAMAERGAMAFAWLPPETLLNEKSSVKSDVWSFGVVVWEVITQGATPLSQLSPNQVCGQAGAGCLHTTLLQGLEQIGDADPDLVQLVQMCLIPDPHKRPFISEVGTVVAAMLAKALGKHMEIAELIA